MTVVADTSALIAFYSESGTEHDGVSAWLAAHDEPIVVSPYVVAELDYLVATRKGVDAELAVLAELAGGAYELAAMTTADIALASDLIARYRDLGIGITDASLVVLAARYGSDTILTLDRRHFGALRSLSGEPLHIVPQ
ncbi:PIN domain-containing protein [Candidatus Poriferisodalis sp.]|uniref:PIN domain-containing protein n=1 Tax=Candidatus Poriferisodalis sp. TaxID=3101277 RepID=UPI003B0187FF